MVEQDTEITLGAGKILGLFFGLVILCGIFFGAGYTLGKNASSTQTGAITPAAGGTTTGAAKPSPNIAGQQPTKSQDCPTPDGCGQPKSDDLTFYKTVEQSEPDAQLTPAQPTEQKASPELNKSAGLPLGAPAPGGYVVQVAAVSKEQDAEALVAALKRKQYPVFIANGGSDRLFHVQAGPFSDPKEAESLRTRLINDGYNPILKR